LALRPAIESLNYTPVRADQDLGGLIIPEMIERLAISDLVIADVSIPNPNVYYELGIRHACQRRGCVLIAAEWAKPLFDIQQMRQLRYPGAGERGRRGPGNEGSRNTLQKHSVTGMRRFAFLSSAAGVP
jgi:hypothetical protein